MAAPIQRYSDPRLYGTTFVKPFNTSYQWIRTVSHPRHPKSALITECAIRAMKIVTGTLALTLTALPALIGRTIQIIHYHTLSNETRTKPQARTINGMQLPQLLPCPLPKPHTYHGTKEAAAISVLRWGFDPTKTAPKSMMGEALYVSADDAVSADYGNDQLILSLDLREGEVAYIDSQTRQKFAAKNSFASKEVSAAVRELYYRNGYRAIKYDLNYHGKEEAWAIYDPSCMTIEKIQPSPEANGPEALAHRLLLA